MPSLRSYGTFTGKGIDFGEKGMCPSGNLLTGIYSIPMYEYKRLSASLVVVNVHVVITLAFKCYNYLLGVPEEFEKV